MILYYFVFHCVLYNPISKLSSLFLTKKSNFAIFPIALILASVAKDLRWCQNRHDASSDVSDSKGNIVLRQEIIGRENRSTYLSGNKKHMKVKS